MISSKMFIHVRMLHGPIGPLVGSGTHFAAERYLDRFALSLSVSALIVIQPWLMERRERPWSRPQNRKRYNIIWFERCEWSFYLAVITANLIDFNVYLPPWSNDKIHLVRAFRFRRPELRLRNLCADMKSRNDPVIWNSENGAWEFFADCLTQRPMSAVDSLWVPTLGEHNISMIEAHARETCCSARCDDGQIDRDCINRDNLSFEYICLFFFNCMW